MTDPCVDSPHHVENIASEKTILGKLIGPAAEVQIGIEGVSCTALFDSGSQVTTVSEAFYQQELSHLSLHSLDTLLEITGAADQLVQYMGYIEVDIQLRSVMLLGSLKSTAV